MNKKKGNYDLEYYSANILLLISAVFALYLAQMFLSNTRRNAAEQNFKTPLYKIKYAMKSVNDNNNVTNDDSTISKILQMRRSFCNADVAKTGYCLPLRYRIPAGPVTALASFPGSGNTWLRHLIQQSTGLLTGSEFRDRGLCKGGFPATGIRDGSVAVVKTHFPIMPSKWRVKYERAVLLIRDPFKASLADFNRQISGNNHTGIATLKQWRRFFPTYIKRRTSNWSKMYFKWCRRIRKENRIFVRYEDLKKDPEKELRRILTFLNVRIDERALECTLKNKEGNFKRRKVKKPPEFVFGTRKKWRKVAERTYQRIGLEQERS